MEIRNCSVFTQLNWAARKKSSNKHSMLRTFFLMLQERDRFPCLFINSPFMDCSAKVKEATCPAKRSWHLWLVAPDASRCFACKHPDGGLPLPGAIFHFTSALVQTESRARSGDPGREGASYPAPSG